MWVHPLNLHAKVFDVNQEPYTPYLSIQFSNTYDAYLDICRRVDQQIHESLGYATAPERLRHACPPCFYKLKDEPELEFSSFVSIDGGNSLKRVGTAVRGVNDRLDTRSIESDRWVPPEEVDQFKDEVKPRVSGASVNLIRHADFIQATKKKEDVVDTNDDWEDVEDNSLGIRCVNRWRNAGPEERKRMFDLFEESGIFIASCRHRLVLLACDMIKSGELYVYNSFTIPFLMKIQCEIPPCYCQPTDRHIRQQDWLCV
jgi:hypothetical protein